MKAPLDPTEPLYPVRPNEPLCQYYLKHGTCKFAQACKFHHPPQSQAQTHTAVLNGQTVLVMNVPRQPASEHVQQSHLVLNPITSELQYLPQRPDEQDCIYFLKNGRCKYGATCRYHHPLNYHQRRVEEQRRHHEQQRRSHAQGGQDRLQSVHYVSQPSNNNLQGPVYIPDNSFAFVNIERDSGPIYQPFSVIKGPDSTSPFCVPVGSTVATNEQGSSASSLASSFETAVSNVDHLPGSIHGNDANTLWNRRNGSGSNLNMHNDLRGQNRVILSHSASDGNISRRSRTSSHGSASDHTTYYDPAAPTMRRNGSAGSWRADRGSPFDQGMSPHQYGQRLDNDSKSPHVDGRQPIPRSRPPGFAPTQSSRRGLPRRGNTAQEGDDSFSMMTSVLLDMLDLPEEVSTDNFSDEDPHQSKAVYTQNDDRDFDTTMFNRLTLSSVSPGGGFMPRPEGNDQWSPTWQVSHNEEGVHPDARLMEMMHSRQPQRPPPTGSPHPHDSNVGLYLP